MGTWQTQIKQHHAISSKDQTRETKTKRRRARRQRLHSAASVFFSFCLAFSMMPLPAYAVGDDAEGENAISEPVTELGQPAVEGEQASPEAPEPDAPAGESPDAEAPADEAADAEAPTGEAAEAEAPADEAASDQIDA